MNIHQQEETVIMKDGNNLLTRVQLLIKLLQIFGSTDTLMERIHILTIGFSLKQNTMS